MSTPSLIETLASPVLGFFGVVTGAAGVWHANRTKSRQDTALAGRDDDREDRTATDARWQAMLDSQRKDFETLLEPMRTQLDGLTTKVTLLEAALDKVSGYYRAALDYIRQLRHWGADPSAGPMPEIPAKLAEQV
ncbi:hypothetical protein O4215_20745 [Rhodococcus maanshanensis]|uniref:hypothetical protein n=1 Tax=Rhodococcus maanshanensis TaxID=183556 RepID=UPI0022B57A4D|nr:hypothetical protein [Rhodococcus maanshanensis]MCZ4557994.1 hypothetical protein [Rhodococcus maanshanensis]